MRSISVKNEVDRFQVEQRGAGFKDFLEQRTRSMMQEKLESRPDGLPDEPILMHRRLEWVAEDADAYLKLWGTSPPNSTLREALDAFPLEEAYRSMLIYCEVRYVTVRDYLRMMEAEQLRAINWLEDTGFLPRECRTKVPV